MDVDTSLASRFPEPASISKPIWLIVTLVAWTAFVVVGHVRYAPPAPLSIDEAGEQEFSAERADSILKILVGDGIPHPAGSQQDKVVRQRIVKLLQGWGYDVDQQETSRGLGRQTGGEPIPLVNIIARLDGTVRGPAVMLASHYDSRTGPGASDDGVGTAALLEIARMMKNSPPPRNDVVFLITDGEELGLLGADKFVEECDLASHVGLVINLEARGTTGPSLMFETSDNSLWLIGLFARSVRRPMASSLFYEIYKFLPNDTDFTIFRRAGIEGYNFAFIGDVKNYHTLEDKYENVDRGCLQHHGQNALVLLRKLSGMDLANQPSGRAVYFDLFGWVVVWWPESWSIYLSLICFAGLLLVAWMRSRRSQTESWQDLVLAAGLMTLCLVAAIGVISGVNFLMTLDERFQFPWPPVALPIELNFWFAAIFIVSLFVAWIPGFRKSTSIWLAACCFWLLLSVLTSIYLAGASYLFLVPLLITVIIAVVGCGLSEERIQFVFAVLAIAVGLIWLPNERLFYDAVGFKMNLFLAARVAIVLIALIPVLAAAKPTTIRRFAWLNLGAFVICTITSIALNWSVAD